MTISSFVEVKNTKANHLYKIQTKLAKVNFFKDSFFVRIVKDWNSLPHHLFTDQISFDKFKKRLKKMDEDLLTQKRVFDNFLTFLKFS